MLEVRFIEDPARIGFEVVHADGSGEFRGFMRY